MVESDNEYQANPKSNVIRVLHIDDEEDFLFLTKEFVEKMSDGEIQVESLQDPMKVFDRIKENNIDLIVCDYLMENFNGLDLLKQIKDKEYQIPFIIFTGRGREEVVIDALNLGADYYIRKGSDARSQYTELVHQIRTSVRHKLAEQALLESEKTIRRERDLTQQYLNEANVLFVIIDRDENTELINKEVTKVLGYSEKELLGQNWFTTVYSTEIVDEIRFNFQQIMTGMRKPTPYSELEIETKTGEKRLIAWHNTILTDEDGKISKLLGIGDDITQKKEIEEALQRSEEQYRKLVDTSPYSIVLADLQGNITFANQQAAVMHGVEKPEELIGSSMMEYTAPEDQQRVMERMRKQMFSTLKGSFEYTLLKKNGERFLTEMNASVLTDKTNKPIALMAIARDLTESKEAEKALKESEEKYRGFVQNFDGIAFRGSIDFRPFFFHGAVEKITGYSEKDFIEGDLSWDKLVLPEDLGILMAIRDELESTPGFSSVLEYRIKNKNDEIRWIRQHVQNIGPGEGEPFIVQGSLHDITENKLIEENLRESEQKFKSLFEGIPDAVFVADPDTQNIVDCNEQAELLLGCPREEVLSKKVLDLHPDDQKEVAQKNFEQHSMGDEEIFETSVLACNGQNIPVSINANLITIKGKEYVLGIFRDITESITKDAELEKSETRYRRLIETSPDGILLTDLNGKILLANSQAEKLYGASNIEELLNFPIRDFIPPENHQKVDEMTKEVLELGVMKNQELSIFRKDGSIFSAEINISRIDDFAENPIAFMSIIRDISQRKEAEKKLEESAKLYMTLFEATGTANAIARAEDAIVEKINNRLVELSGYTREEIEGKVPWHSFVHESELERLMEYNTKRIIDPSSAPANYEVKLKNKRGDVVDCLLHVGIIPDTDRFIISIIDISESKQAEQNLQKTAELYKTVFEAKGTANMIVGPGRIIIETNSLLEEISGYGKDVLIGRNWTDFVPESELDKLVEYSRKRQLEPQNFPAYYESQFINRKGDIRDVMVSLTTIPLSENYVVSLFDITELKEAEEEIRKSEILYRSLFENTGMANIIFDLEASITLVNSRMEELSGYTRKELEGRKWTEFIPQPELDLMTEYNRRRMMQPDSVPNQYETRFITKNGTIRSILIAVTNLPDSNSFLATVVDISERSKMVNILTKQKKELSDFVHLMGHDIRNSLSSIEGYADILKENDNQKDVVLDKINNQTDYLRKLLNRSIELAEAGQVIEKSDIVNLDRLVDRIAKVTIPQDIKMKHDPLVAVKADEEKLSQIFKNLFENAVIHGKPTQIEILSKLHENEIGICIANNGTKIDPEIAREAFESTFTTKEKESIHGLTIVKKLIDAHGWKIRLLNEQDEACFEILIPKEDVTESK